MDITLFPNKPNLFFKKIKSKADFNSDSCDGYLIESDEKEIRRILDTLKAKKEKKLIAVQGKDDEFNRRMIETCKINFLVSPENLGTDTLKQRGSGLNHVLAKAAKKNNIAVVINFSNFASDKKQQALRIARIMQNIIICRKSGCKIKIATFAESQSQLRDERELKSFLFSLGASSQQASDGCNF